MELPFSTRLEQHGTWTGKKAQLCGAQAATQAEPGWGGGRRCYSSPAAHQKQPRPLTMAGPHRSLPQSKQRVYPGPGLPSLAWHQQQGFPCRGAEAGGVISLKGKGDLDPSLHQAEQGQQLLLNAYIRRQRTFSHCSLPSL